MLVDDLPVKTSDLWARSREEMRHDDDARPKHTDTWKPRRSRCDEWTRQVASMPNISSSTVWNREKVSQQQRIDRNAKFINII